MHIKKNKLISHLDAKTINYISSIHEKLLEMLKYFDKICNDNNLTYFADGGTLLGAEIHKGFIPWDDDVDILMPRKDYDKLMLLKNSEKFGKYEFKDMYSDPDYTFFFMKMYDKDTTFIETNLAIGGVFMDIFPLDHYDKNYNSYKKLRKLNKAIKWSVNIKDTYKELMYYEYSKLKFLSRYLTKLLSNRSKALKNFDKMFYKFNENNLYYINYHGNGRSQIYKKEWFTSKLLLSFEDTFIPVPNGYINILEQEYPKYKTIPKEIERFPAHFSMHYDFNKPYSLFKIKDLSKNK